MNKSAINKAKKYVKKNGISLSKMVDDFLKELTRPQEKINIKKTPLV